MAVGPAEIIMMPSLDWGKDYHRKFQATMQVIADVWHGPLAISTASGIPAYGTPYSLIVDGNQQEYDNWAFCDSISIEHVHRINADDGTNTPKNRWVLKLTFSSTPSDHNPSKARNNPLLDPPVSSGSFIGYRRPTHRDKDGNLIRNSAYDLYTPAVEVDDANDTLRISYNTSTIDLAFRAGFRNTVNSDSIWGLPARTVKLRQWGWRVQYAGDFFSYIRHDFEFEISYQPVPTDPNQVCIGSSLANANTYGFYTVLPNSGHAYFDEGIYTSGTDEENRIENKKRYKKVTDGEDMPTNELANLKCNGDIAPRGTNQYWNIYKVETEKDFRTIPGMPTTVQELIS